MRKLHGWEEYLEVICQMLKTKRDAWLSFFLTNTYTKIWKQIFRSDFTRKYNWYETLFLLLRFHNSFCEMVAPPFLEMTKDYLAEQNNFLNSPFPKQLVWKPHHIGIKMITLSAGLWLLFLCFLKLNKGCCWFRHWVLACLQPSVEICRHPPKIKCFHIWH